MNVFEKSTSLFLLFLSSTFAWGHQKLDYQNSTIFPFQIETFFSQNGLPQNQVTSIICTKNKIIYLSTANGIVRFNGNKIKLIDTQTPNLKIVYQKIHYDEKTKQLFGINFGGELYQITPKTRKIVSSSAICFKDNAIYYAKKDGSIYQYFPENNKHIFIHRFQTNPNFKFILHDQKIYYSINNESFEYDIKSKKTKKKGPRILEYVHSNDKLIAIGEKAIWDLKNSEKPIFNIPFNGIVYDVYFNKKNSVFHIGTTVGYFTVSLTETKKYSLENGFPSNIIMSVKGVDEEDVVYLGTSQRGLLKLQLNQNVLKDELTKLKENALTSIVTYKNQIFYGSSNKAIFEVKNDYSIPYFNAKEQIASLNLIADTFYVGTWGHGILVYHNKKHIRTIKNLPSLSVHAVYQDKNKSIWIGTSDGIAFGNEWNKLKTIHPIGQFISFYQLKNGNICAGGSEGVIIFNPQGKVVQRITVKDGLIGKEVRAFLEDEHGRLWIGSYGGGLYYYYNGKLISVNQQKYAFLNNDIFTLALDHNNILWMTSNQGLYAIQLNALTRFIEGKNDFLIPYFFNQNHGLYNPEFNGGFYPNYQFHNNKIYFPSIEGLTIIKPIQFAKINTIGTVEKLILDETKTIQNDHFSIPPGVHTFRFELDIPNHNSSRQVFVQYAIKKDGVLSPWSKPSSSDEVVINGLSSGRYQINIRFIDSQNQIMPKVHQYHFQIQAYFYENTLFYIVISLFSIFVISSILYVNINKKKIRNQEKFEIEKQFLELKQAAIHARMNPHFIFNSLNSLKSSLSTKKWEDAENLTENFSLLLRDFLHYSEKNFISIKDEVNLLKRYLTIEKTRFKDLLDFEIEIDSQIKDKLIPTMLILPLVENAINHGISHLFQPGKIKLGFSQQNNQIIIEVIDNGIGFEKSKEINKHRVNHQSRGIKLLQDKIENLKKYQSISVEIFIQSNDNETKITLILPL